ncbi:zinc metalloprotease HtpX [Cucumibacter marinus]|uniref:zinc metalloprotease HtpX n=1 Tax=Cucumibacter marinus TaxID=1121252 RepID=UPI00040F2008|nr:zinc metalloprotease HtpX [Cucumibacter marinus]
MVNAMRTTFLLAALTGLFMAIGFAVAGTGGMLLALAIALVMNLFAYWNSDKLVLRMQHAMPIPRERAPELYDMVADLSDRAGIPMPRVYVINSKQPNAFATGRNPDNAAVAVSSGLLQHLSYEEVAAVVAHELAHIRSRDTLTMTITATLAGAISMLAQFGLFFGARNSNSPFGPLGGLLMIIIAPIAAIMVQMAVSRTREYEADKDGAEICGDPMALASALHKISQLAKNFENPWARRQPAMAHLFIINPLAGRRMDNLFSTHPDVRNRIEALKELARQTGRQPIQRAAQRDIPVRAAPRRVGRGSAWRIPDADPHGSAARRAPPRNAGPWG